jgi:GAF domain-containing protein
MTAGEMNVARYIREQSEELKKLSKQARLDVLGHLFGMAAAEATKHEDDMRSPMMPRVNRHQPVLDSVPVEDARQRAVLQDILGGLVGAAENRSEGEARAAFYLADAGGTGLHRIAGMDPAYGAFTAGFAVGKQSIACGLAAAIRRPVVTPDVTRDPAWENWRWLADAFNYRGCWSFPIEGRGGKVLGTFSMYFTRPSSASGRDFEFASIMTDAAAEIMSRKRVFS